MHLADRGRRDGLLGKGKENFRKVANAQLTTQNLASFEVAERGHWERKRGGTRREGGRGESARE